ncbi:MAG: acetyltransferase [Myxococcaceae bacterium]|nr:acetyltransferase [Myxococcaceae bacterium]
MASRRTVSIYGAKGHGKVIAEMVLECGDEVGGFLDDGVPAGTPVLSSVVLGGFDALARLPRGSWVALGIGANRVRERIAQRLVDAGFRLATVVHPSAVISPSATVGEGTVVMALAVVSAEARVGRGVILNTRSVTEHECVVDDFAHLSPGATLGGQARIGKRTHVGLNASVIHLGTVGDDVTVGAGACVVRPVDSNLTVVGVPARPLARRS